MHVSVIIPTFNSGPELESTIRSALFQKLPPLEVICVDDLSENDTITRIEGMVSSSSGRLRVIRRSERGGTGAARNTGLEAARGDWIALLDHDDLWAPEKLAVQAEIADANPEAALIHSRCWEQAGEDEASRTLMHESKAFPEGNAFPYLFLSNFISPCAVIMKRDVVLEAGGFDTRKDRPGKDDIDLFLRLALRGVRFAHTEQPLAIRRLHGGNFSRNEREFLSGRYAVLDEFFELDQAGPRRLLASEGITRVMGLLFALAAYEIQSSGWNAAVGTVNRIRERTVEELSLLQNAVKDAEFNPRRGFLNAVVSPRRKKQDDLRILHVTESKRAATRAISNAAAIVRAFDEAKADQDFVREQLQRDAEAAARASRQAYRRRVEAKRKFGVSLSPYPGPEGG